MLRVAAVFVARDGRRLRRMEDHAARNAARPYRSTDTPWHGTACLMTACRPMASPSPPRMTTISALGRSRQPKAPSSLDGAQCADPEAVAARGGGQDELRRAKWGRWWTARRLIQWALLCSYLRVPTVRETGNMRCAVAWSICSGQHCTAPLRFDFFGKQLETDPQLRSGRRSVRPERWQRSSRSRR